MNIAKMDTNKLVESSYIEKSKTDMQHDTFTNYFDDVEEEKWMKDIYIIITTSSLKTLKRHQNFKGELVGISLPKTFVSEVLNFKNINDYLNQFKLFMILLFIEKDGYYHDESNKIFVSLQRYLRKKQRVIYDALIQEYVYRYLSDGYIPSSEYLKESFYLDPDSIWTLVAKIKRLYNNEVYQVNYAFPLNDDDEVDLFAQRANDIYDIWNDENDEEVFEQIKKITLELIYKMIKPISDVNIDYLFTMARESSIYLEYLSKSKMKPYEFNEFFMETLYIKLTKQPKMSILRYCYYGKIDLYFTEFEGKSYYKWQEENNPYQFSMIQSDYINHIKKGKVINKNSSKFIGDKYEQYCELWLQKNGYTDTKIVGQKGDKGIDIKALHPDGQKIGIQCKYKDAGVVGSSDIRLLHTAKEYHDIEKSLLIANCSLSREAVKDMEKFNIIAIILPYTQKE